MSGNSPKQLEAKPRNAQRSIKSGNACGPRTPTDGVAAIPDQGRGQASDRGSLTIELKPFGVLEATLVEKIAVAHCRRFCVLSSSLGAFRIFRYRYAIERQHNRAITQLLRLQDDRCLFHLQPSETRPIEQN